MRIGIFIACLVAGSWPGVLCAEQEGAGGVDKFRQLGPLLRDASVYRSASGAPGPQYWQQRADYKIKARLDEQARTLTASQTIRYTNASPDSLRYLWLQLEQNRFRADSLDSRSRTAAVAEDGYSDQLGFNEMRRHQALQDNNHGFNLTRVEDGGGKPLSYTIVDAMMRVDLPRPLAAGAAISLRIDWNFSILDEEAMGSRGGYEWFEENDTYIYFLAQWFPRMVAYTDYTSWQHKAFLGRGEFTLEFGDYEVELTVPADHIVSATGTLTNAREVLTSSQRQRLAEAREGGRPVYIVTPEEAAENEKTAAPGTRTWRFNARNVRDFAWASSRKFIWDAMGHQQQEGEHKTVLAMSFYPNEADPIWSRYSTEAVVHTMEVYSRFAFPYPYPTAQSVNTWEVGGMEYPMITFNGFRPEPVEAEDRENLVADTPDSTYSRTTKHLLIGVIIHEIGHIYFPMTVNSDERQWTWMDEGINTFLEHLAELEWEENFHSFNDELSILDYIGGYMQSGDQVPIMTQSDSVLQFGPNAYIKPAAALVVLRETVMGRELFDFAFKEYARRWRFKRPTPADFFRTMEDASGVDLDWFWRGWFFSTDHVDVAVAGVREYKVSSMDPDVEAPHQRRLDRQRRAEPIEQVRNRQAQRRTRVQQNPELEDFYNRHDPYTVSNADRNAYEEYIAALEPWQQRVLARAVAADEYIYFVDFFNVGGLVTPLPLELTYADGSRQRVDIPAEIWRRNAEQVTRVFISPQRLTAVELDPAHQTADVDRANNYFPGRIQPSRIELYKREKDDRNLMLDMLVKLRAKDDSAGDDPAVPLSRPE